MSLTTTAVHRFVFGLVMACAFSASAAEKMDVNFRYRPATWNTAINLQDDWQKTLVSETGAMLYDYPGPHSKFKTVISAGILAGEMKTVSQRLYDPKTPIVVTTSEGSSVTLKQEAFAIVDSPFKVSNRPKPRLHRVGRENTITEWANPPANSDPAFRHAAFGQKQPIRYAYDLPAGGSRTVVVGLIEAFYRQAGKRLLEVEVEGSASRIIDAFAMSGHNKPLLVYFNGHDSNSDGKIAIEVRPVKHSPQRDTVLSAVWILPKGSRPEGKQVDSRKLTATAEAYVSCGEDPNLHTFAPRRDVLHLEYQGSNFQPVLKLRTTRKVSLDNKTGVVSFNGQPFFVSRPAPLSAQVRDGQTILVYENSLQQIDVVFVRGPELPTSSFAAINYSHERARAVNHWAKADLPWNKIQVPDAGIQALLNSSVRNIFQAREIKNGKPEFRVGPTVYRDMWLVDGSFLLETATLLGKVEDVRPAIDRILDYQQPSGQVIVLQPDFYKETGITLWILRRHAQLTQDKAWLEGRWKNIREGVKWIKAIRIAASRNPAAPHAGLMPPGHPDGGLEGPVSEYTNVYWNLMGLKAAIESAHMLGKTAEAADWEREYNDFHATFQKAAARDMRTDTKGNKYLPILMNHGPENLAQKGQWAFAQAIFPGKLFAPNDPIATGTLAMLDGVNSQGLVMSTGWMTGGIWTYFASFYGHAHLWLGGEARIKKAQDVLYAFANHASPLLVWREEQKPVGQGLQMIGDMPHNWASAEFIRLVRHLIAIERGDRLVMFEGVPSTWLQPGKELSLNGIATEFGLLTLRARVSGDGQQASIEVAPIGLGGQAGAPVIDLKVFKALGFRSESGKQLPDEVVGTWGRALKVNLRK